MNPAALPDDVRDLLLQPLDQVTCGELDRVLAAHGTGVVAGVDEAGRGPLAGPLVAAAVVIPSDVDVAVQLAGLDDSKKMTAAARERLFPLVRDLCHVAVVVRSARDVDDLGINPANHGAMLQAVAELPVLADLALIDGYRLPDATRAHDTIPTLQVVKGDRRAACIAAASVIAKVTRDRMMHVLHQAHPEYGFAGHKGYGTRAHLDALAEHGPCAAHRRTFRPVADAIAQPSLDLTDAA